MPGQSFIGVAIAVGGNVIISLALTVQKLAHRRLEDQASRSAITTPDVEQEQEVAEGEHGYVTLPVEVRVDQGQEPTIHIIQPSPSRATSGMNSPKDDESDDDDSSNVSEGAYLKSKLWWLGLALMSIGECGNFLSYGFAPASVVAPLGTVALVANCIFAPLILKERFRIKDLVGVGLAILGAVTVVWSSRDSNPRLNPEQLRQAILRPTFIAYTAVNMVLMAVAVFLSRTRYGTKYIAIDVGLCALFGGFTVLSTKAISSLLSRMFFTAFRYPIAWFLIFVLATTSIAQIKYLNKALMRFESKEVIPTQFVFFSIAAIVGSAVLYQEFRDIPFTRLANFFFGIATTFLGVHLLTSTVMSSSSDTSPTPNEESNLSTPHIAGGLEPVGEETPLLLPVTVNNATFPRRIKLHKRQSNSNLTPSMGSQAGFLLLATTPPAGAPLRRERSTSRSNVMTVGSHGNERRFRRSSLEG